MRDWTTRTVRISRGIVALASLASLACSSSTSSNASAPADAAADGVVGCQAEGETYSANMETPGTMGKYTFTLAQANPAPPGIDGNTWTVKIVDANGTAPMTSQLAAVPFMPQMGHGTSQTPTFTSNADGTFTVSDVYLFMDGLWTVTFTVNAAGDGGTPTVLDKAVYTFCIDG